jgi:hypothetical protein|tara:strand:- start:8340 stop:10358 length:2019 start_codon:yes stop_codon:yes gene_type:complete
MKPLTKGALEWAADGVPVFPCAANKRPMTEKGFYDATTDPVAVKQMFDLAGDDALIGGRMGQESGLFACDFDTYKPGDAGEAAQQYMAHLIGKGLLPETQRHKTMNGGLHLIYQSKHGYPNCKPSAGVEIKGEGGYIILPPSKGYAIDADVGFVTAPRALIEELMKARQQHTDKTLSQHEDAISAADDFHDSVTSLVAKMFSQGRPASEVTARVMAALDASVARSSNHPRHERWLSLIEDRGGELSRIINSGRDKFDTKAKTERSRDYVSSDDAQRRADAAAAAGFAPAPQERNETPETAPSPDDYAGLWPFEGEGYFTHEQLNIADQRFVMHPLFAEDESVVFAAAPKTGKTAVSLKLFMQVAAGRSLGPFNVTDRRGVLYYALEGTRAIKLRIEAEKRSQADAGTPLPDDMPMFVIERPTNLISKSDENVAKVVAADRHMKEHYGFGLGIVAIDTLTKAMPGKNQNDVEDTSALFDFTSKLRIHGVKATVVYVHHTGKDGQTRGSSNIEADVDVVLKMKKQEDGASLLYVHMARSIDDNNIYAFDLTSYDLGETAQGIMQAAPVVTLREGNAGTADNSNEAATRAHVIAPYLKALLVLDSGDYGINELYTHWVDADLMERSRARRKKAVLDILGLIFDREAEVVYRGHVYARSTDAAGEISGIKVTVPGD